MFPLHRGAELFLAIAILALWSGNESLAADSNQRVVCYYTNWSVYRPGTAKFTPQNINPYLCTHLIYSFGGFTKENTLKPYDKYQDIEQGGFAKFTGLKTYNKNLKTLLAIGGWNEGSSRFSPLVADAERRNQFVKNTIKFLRQNHFDGLDLDWEYPAFRDGSKPKDRENYAQLVQELREEFERESSKTGRPRLLLTMAVPAGIEYVEKGYDVPKLNKYLDWFNLLSYDYHSAYEPAVNHHSPLFSLEEASEYNFDSELNIDYSVKFYLKAGADRDKLVLGIPTYGRSYTLYNPDATDIGAPADGPGEQGDATREKGYLAYYEICSNLKDSSDWTVVQPNPKAMGPYAYKGNQWVGYDDEAIARRKAKYVAENGLGGIMFWSIDNDDFRGTCHGKPYPIIEAAKEALLASTEVGINDVASSSRPRKPSRSRSRPGSATRNRVNTDNNNEIKASFKTSQGRKVARPVRVTTTSTTTTTTTEDSLYIGGRTTTPQPPTTPDPGADFKCEDEGFFPHPRDCKKYFWCLDSPSLGLVAHQFTCPSGLVFNKQADSCDYARNVICSKTVATTSTTSTTSTTTTVATPTTSTTPRPRITIPTNRNNFFNRGTFTTTTTTEPTVEVDYSDEDNTETQPEEDPKVIKELIALIKKVGGIEELEKQLQAQEDGSILLKDAASDQISTTAPTISKSLYERVLSRTGTVGQKFRPAITFTQQDKTGSLPENKYSSVVRNSYTNSRVGPQNEGLDQLPEFEGVFREKPKYVTLQRVRPTKATSIEDRYDDDEDIDEEENQPSTFTTSKPTSVPKYVSIRRQRPTTIAEQDSDVDGEDAAQDEEREGEKFSAGGAQYSAVNRNWNRRPTEASNVAESEPERSSPNRYNTIDRRRTTSVPYTSSRLQDAERDDVGTDSSLLVPSTDFQTIYTTASTTTIDPSQSSEPNLIPYSTRQYSSVERVNSNTISNDNDRGGNSESSSSSNSSNDSDSSTSSGSDAAAPKPSNLVAFSSATTAPNSDSAEEPEQVQVLSNVDYQPTPEVTDTTNVPIVPTLHKTDDGINGDGAKTPLGDAMLEVTTILNTGESVTGSSVSSLDAGLEGSDTFANNDKRFEPLYDGGEKGFTDYEAIVTTTTTTGAPPSVPSTTAVPATASSLTNDATSNSVFKFTRTRKPSTTTTATLEPVTNPSRKVPPGSGVAPIKAAPRPFAAGARRTRPTRLPETANSLATTTAPELESTTLRSVKVSFSNAQRFDLSASRQRRVGSATPESSELVDGRQINEQPATRATVRGNRGRVRFRTAAEKSVASTPLSSDDSQSTKSSDKFVSTTTTQTTRRRSRPSTGELAANRFAIGRTTTVSSSASTPTVEPLTTASDRGSLRRVNFSLYSGRRASDTVSTTSTEEPRIETETYDNVTPFDQAEIKSYTRIAEDPFMTQERILLTLGTALRYGFSSRNELTSGTASPTFPTQPVQEFSSTLAPARSTFKGRPFGRENVDNMVNNGLAENLNDMSTESNAQFFEDPVTSDGRLLNELTTVYNVNAAEVDTTTPQPRKLVSSSLRDRYSASSTTEAVDTTLNVVVSEVNTNKTFIPGRTRPTRPARLRTTLDASTGSTAAEQEVTRSPSRRPFASRKQPNGDVFSSRFAPPEETLGNDVTERATGISTTKRQRVNRRRTTTTTTPATATTAADESPVTRGRNAFNTDQRRQRLPGNRFLKTASTTTSTESFTAEPTYPDSNVANSDFTTVITDTSNEIASGYDLLNSDNLLNLPNLRTSEDIDEEDATETLSTLAVSATEANPSANLVSGGLTQPPKPQKLTSSDGTRINDSQQIESESIPSRSSTRVFGSGATRRKFTGKFVTTEAPEPTEPIKKFVPTRRNRPSFSLARNGRLSTTTEDSSFVATTADADGTVSAGPAPFVPSRKRKPLLLGSRTSTTAAPLNEGANGDDSVQPSARPTRRRPAYSLNRPARPQAFENSFDKATVTSKPVEQKSINRTSVLLPKRPNLFARTTTTTSTTTVAPFGADATDRTTLEDRFSSSEEQRYSGEENEGDNEIQRQGKRLFGQLGSDASNSLVPQEVDTEKPRPEPTYGGVRRPGSRIGPTPARAQPNSGSNRFIFKNNQPAATGNSEGTASLTTQRTFTTRTRRPFGNVGGYKPTAQNGTVLSGDSGAPVAGSVTTPRPRFTPTTRTRPTFGRLRSTTASLASKSDAGTDGERVVVASTLNDLEQGAGFATRRYQPRKPTSRRNFTSVSVPVTSVGSGVGSFYNGTRAGQNVTLPAVFLLTTQDTAEGIQQTTPSQTLKETTLTAAEFPTDDTKQPHDSTTAFTVVSPIASQNGTDELTPTTTTTTTSPWLLETVNGAENTTSYEDTVNTFRTTTEYYTASDETHYTTLNTADTIYTINDNIDIDDVNVLQDRSRTSTTTVKPTTLYHVFSIDKENESVPSSTEIYRTEEQEIELPAANRTDKLVKIHRVVEIYTKNTSNPDELPVMQKLGEINRKIIIRLVEPNRANNRTGGTSSSSSYTTTTLGSGAPVTERVDDEDTDNGRGRTVVLSSNSVFTVETSTIPLEGLFDPEKGVGFPTTDMPPQADAEQLDDVPTVAPHPEIERISSVDFSSATGASPLEQDDELPAVTQLAAETDRYVQVTSLRPDLTDDTDTESSNDDRQQGNGYKPQTTDLYFNPAEELTTTATVAAEPEETTFKTVTVSTTRTTPVVVSSSTQREIVHKYTLPAEFSFQEPSSETTTTKTTTTTPATTTSSSSAPELLTTTPADLPSGSSTVVDRVQSLVLPSKESKKKYTKRPESVLTASRVSDFAYSRDSSAEADNERVVATTEPLYMTEPVPVTTTKATNTRHYTNNRKYVSSLSLRPNFSTPEATQNSGGPSYRKSKDIPVVPLPKVISSKSATQRVPTTTTETTTTTTTTTTPAPITKIDFNIKYVLPVNLPDANSHELKIESKNDKYSVPLSPILRPDFITREISGERQDRQFSPVYRPELDNDELTRQLTSDADPVALEAEHLDREILGDGDSRQSAEGGASLGTAEQLVSHSIPSSAAYFLRRTAEVS
ncbi:mucin-5AC-like [Anopheles maculipalpis]|uniref:mucin-5AC-like n=1 Tax=Anopheles maculipalpis TaxID=1496333 RepID=UPI002159791E|nr:mucin-5AC-like [Anopheles maculipalpis]